MMDTGSQLASIFIFSLGRSLVGWGCWLSGGSSHPGKAFLDKLSAILNLVKMMINHDDMLRVGDKKNLSLVPWEHRKVGLGLQAGLDTSGQHLDK